MHICDSGLAREWGSLDVAIYISTPSEPLQVGPRRAGLGLGEHEITDHSVSGGLQRCIALGALGKLVGERKLVPKFGVFVLECTVKGILRVTSGDRRRRRARTTGSTGRADLGRR